MNQQIFESRCKGKSPNIDSTTCIFYIYVQCNIETLQSYSERISHRDSHFENISFATQNFNKSK